METLEKTTPASDQTGSVPETAAKPVKTAAQKKKRRRRIRLCILAVLLIAGGIFAWRHFKGADSKENVAATDTVQYGSITSMVTGNGLTKAKKSETISLTTEGTVVDVFVTEGQKVNEGDPLFTIDSPKAYTAVQQARSDVEGYEKQLTTAQKEIDDLNLAAPYAGKILETVKLVPGEDFAGGKVATLVDDTRMRLTQFYSYAYEGSLHAGQTVTVSVPALMTSVSGTVEAVHMVDRVTAEGSKLFSVDIVLKNEGVLAAGMVATATVKAGGEEVYPYEAGKLEYYRSMALTAGSGTVISTKLLDYLTVSAGQLLVQIDGAQSESKIFTIQQNLDEARKKLENAEKNLANCNAVAPISGMVIGLAAVPGSPLTINTPLVTISDTSVITVSATVDERNVSYVKAGMPVDLDQWGNISFGTVESVSLSSTVSNGVASYPLVISADNAEGLLQVNSYINYSLTASQNDNCLVLPLQAVRTVGLEDGSMKTVVYVKADSRPDNAVEVPASEEEIPDGFYPVPVEIGIQDNYNVEIKSGVEEGTEVFTQMMTTEVWG